VGDNLRIAVIIPYRHRGDDGLLPWILEGYASQRLAPGNAFDVHIGIDGAEPESLTQIRPPSGLSVGIHRYPRIGAAAVRNALVREASGDTEILVFGNADARPFPDMVQRHASRLAHLPARSLVLGSAPWESPANRSPRVFDAMIARTPMIFQYGQLRPHEWTDFRSAWTLNLSARRSDFIESGGFHEELRPVFYEDLAFAHRLMGLRAGVWYEPETAVQHRHPMTVDGYLDREELLGMMAPVLARVSPGAFSALFKSRHVLQLAAEFRQQVAKESTSLRQVYEELRRAESMPLDALGQAQEQSLMAFFQMHLPLKQFAFRLGFLHGLDLVEDQSWQMRRPAGLWRRILPA